MAIIQFIQEHAAELWMLWGAVITMAFVIVKLTPSKRDDDVLDVVIKVLNALNLNPTNPPNKDEKEKLEEELNERDDNTTRDNLIDVLK